MTERADSERWVQQLAWVVVPWLGCNLRCAHCFVSPDKDAPAMSDAQLLSVLQAIAAVGNHSVEITGGEFSPGHTTSEYWRQR